MITLQIEKILEMESKLNHKILNSYSEKYSTKILDDFFTDKERINGKEILNLCETHQINLFVLKNLLTQWKKEAEKLKSPYFDYNSPEVHKALNEFLNVLSRNILINKEHFKELLEKAVHDTLLIIFSPYDFFINELRNEENVIRVSDLKEYSKYIKINGHLYDAFLNELEKRGLSEEKPAEITAILKGVFENFTGTPEDIDDYIDQLSKTIPLNTDEVYLEDSATNITYPSGGELEETPQTLNEMHRKEEDESIAEKLQNEKIDSINKQLTLNQRFMFVKELFDGDVEEFNKTVDYLDNCQNRDEALSYLEENYTKSSSWDKDSEEVTEFYDLIYRKFS